MGDTSSPPEPPAVRHRRWRVAAVVAGAAALLGVLGVAATPRLLNVREITGWRSPGATAARGNLAELLVPAASIAPGYADLRLAGAEAGGADGRDGRSVVRRSGGAAVPAVIQQLDGVDALQMTVVGVRSLLSPGHAAAVAGVVELTHELPCRGSATARVFHYAEPPGNGAAVVCVRGGIALRVDVMARDGAGRSVPAGEDDLLLLAATVSNRLYDRLPHE